MELPRFCRSALFYFIEGTAELLSTLGTVSELLSGVSVALIPTLDTTLSGDYALAGVVEAQTNSTLTLSNHFYQESWLFKNEDKSLKSVSDSFELNLKDFIRPDNLYLFSSLTFCIGLLLKTSGDSLKYWIQDKKLVERGVIDSEHQMTSKELGLIVLASGLKSAAISTTTAGTVACMYYAKIFRYVYPEIRYPNSGNQTLNTYAPIPLKWDSFSEWLKFNRTFSTRPETDINIGGRLKGTINVQTLLNVDYGYGARITTENLSTPKLYSVAPLLGIGLFQVARYLRNHAEKKTGRRILLSKKALENRGLDEEGNIEFGDVNELNQSEPSVYLNQLTRIR